MTQSSIRKAPVFLLMLLAAMIISREGLPHEGTDYSHFKFGRVLRPSAHTKQVSSRAVTLDTISTACTGLVVRSDGNAGNDTNDLDSGLVHLDFFGGLDCEITTPFRTYLFGSTPFVAYLDGSDTLLNYSIYGDAGVAGIPHRFLDPEAGNPTVPTQSLLDFEVYRSGTFMSRDSSVGIECIWYAPTHPDSCRFVVQNIKFYSYNDSLRSGLLLGVFSDWDVPSDSQVDNRGYWLPDRKAQMYRGVDYTSGPTGCSANSGRFAATVYLGRSTCNSCGIDSSGMPFAAQTVDYRTMIFPQFEISRALMWPLISTSAYGSISDSSDLLSAMTFGPPYTLNPNDTFDVYIAYCVSIATDSAAFMQVVDASRSWFWSHIASIFVPGDPDGSGIVTISDAVYLINYIFGGGGAPFPLGSGDANCDESVTISDAVYLINYIFGGGSAPGCP